MIPDAENNKDILNSLLTNADKKDLSVFGESAQAIEIAQTLLDSSSFKAAKYILSCNSDSIFGQSDVVKKFGVKLVEHMLNAKSKKSYTDLYTIFSESFCPLLETECKSQLKTILITMTENQENSI